MTKRTIIKGPMYLPTTGKFVIFDSYPRGGCEVRTHIGVEARSHCGSLVTMRETAIKLCKQYALIEYLDIYDYNNKQWVSI